MGRDEAPGGSPDQAFDYSADRAAGREPRLAVGPAYDPRPGEDWARRIIAYSLVGLLIAVVLWILALVSFDRIKVDDLKDFAVVLGPVVTLVSAATGFYYGTKAGRGGQ